MARLTSRLFVGGVLLLITTIAYSSQYFIFWRFFRDGYHRALYLGPLNFLVGMIYVNYYLAVTTDPGRVPAKWEAPVLSDVPDLYGTKAAISPRYCKTCGVFKPPRTHHCRHCKRCVLKMDHHCPWISNCVGYMNYGHFFRFTMYVNTATTYIFFLLTWRVYCFTREMRMFRFEYEMTRTESFFVVLNYVLDSIVILTVGILGAYHIWSILTNTTTIEGCEKDRAETLVRRGKIRNAEYPFSLGMYRNLTFVLGPNPLLWWWPQKMKGDGLSYPVRAGLPTSAGYLWPPRDPDERPSIYSSRYRNRDSMHHRRRKGDPHDARRPRHHVRRDSEGYLIREFSYEDRMQAMQNYELGMAQGQFHNLDGEPIVDTMEHHIGMDPTLAIPRPNDMHLPQTDQAPSETDFDANQIDQYDHHYPYSDSASVDSYYDSGSAITDSGEEWEDHAYPQYSEQDVDSMNEEDSIPLGVWASNHANGVTGYTPSKKTM